MPRSVVPSRLLAVGSILFRRAGCLVVCLGRLLLVFGTIHRCIVGLRLLVGLGTLVPLVWLERVLFYSYMYCVVYRIFKYMSVYVHIYG